MEKKHREISSVYRALGHPVRVAMLEALAKKELSRDELLLKVKIPAPNFAQHLGRLRDAKLVLLNRRGQRAYYKLADPKVLQLADAARAVYRRSFEE